MAHAVEGASVVLVCMTEKYLRSKNCRKEFEVRSLENPLLSSMKLPRDTIALCLKIVPSQYAIHNNRTIIPIKFDPTFEPSSWLGINVAGKLYFELGDQDTFESKMIQLKAEIDVRVAERAGAGKGDASEEGSDVKAWSEDDVRA